MNNKITLAGIFYSGYKKTWIDFIRLFRHNWPNCPYEFVIVSDVDKDYFLDGIRIIGCGIKAEYSDKVRKLLKAIQSDYYVLFLEDFFFSERIEDSSFEKIVSFVISNGVQYYSMPMKDFSKGYKGSKTNYKSIKKINEKVEYVINCQPSIWERRFLERCIGNLSYNAWVFEGVYKNSEVSHSSYFLKGCYCDLSNPLSLIHGIVQGKIIRNTYKYFKKRGYILQSDLPLMSIRDDFARKIKIYMPSFLKTAFKRIFKDKGVLKKYNKDIDFVTRSLGL